MEAILALLDFAFKQLQRWATAKDEKDREAAEADARAVLAVVYGVRNETAAAHEARLRALGLDKMSAPAMPKPIDALVGDGSEPKP